MSNEDFSLGRNENIAQSLLFTSLRLNEIFTAE